MPHHLVVTAQPSVPLSLECVSVFSSDIHLALAALGETVVLKSTRDLAPAAYWGTARLEDVDTASDGRHLLLALSNVVPFPHPVPLTANGVPFESALADEAGRIVFGRHAIGMRSIPKSEYDAVLAVAGIAPAMGLEESVANFAPSNAGQTNEEKCLPTEAALAWARRRRRDASLRNRLIRHYGAFCLLSGVSMDVPGGASMLQLSHLHPLYREGPDHATNAALKTPNIHAIWENGLVTVRSDYSLRFAPDIPPGFKADFKGRTRAAFSTSAEFAPRTDCLAFHRQEIFERRLKRLGLSTAD